jgi:hypothetical protein
MNFSDFIKTFDKENNICLLIGKREVSESDKDKLRRVAKLLANTTNYLKFRTGNASGSDEIFAEGVVEINKNKLELVKPYATHRKNFSEGLYSISLDNIDIMNEPEIIYETKQGKSTSIVERYINGIKDRNSVKAAYLLRDALMVMGSKKMHIKPASVVIYYDDMSKPKEGGTGFTVKLSEKQNICCFNQQIWTTWVDENK